jgi:uncharacterized Zn finger protein (UPF0148 family)
MMNAETKAIADRELDYFRLQPQIPPEREAGKTAQADLFGGPKVADLPCEFCGYPFDREALGRYGCPNCEGQG